MIYKKKYLAKFDQKLHFFYFFKHEKIARSRRVDNGLRNFGLKCDRWNFEIVVFISLFIYPAALCLSKQSMILHRYGTAVSMCLPAVLIFSQMSPQN